VTPSVDDYINAFMSAFRAQRGEKTIFAGGRSVKVRTAGERIIHLPNGHQVKVTTDDSGIATQVEENDALHAIVRPHTIRRKLSVEEAAPLIHAATTPATIRTRATPRR
jgi:hypothetical protein